MADSRFINETNNNNFLFPKISFPSQPSLSPKQDLSFFLSRKLLLSIPWKELRISWTRASPSSLPPLFIACTSAHPLPVPANEKIYGTTRDTEMSKPRCYALPAPLIKRSSRKSGARRKRKLRHPAFLRYRRSLSIIIHPVKNRPRRPCFSSTLHSTGLRAVGRGRKNAYLSIEQFLIKRYNIR